MRRTAMATVATATTTTTTTFNSYFLVYCFSRMLDNENNSDILFKNDHCGCKYHTKTELWPTKRKRNDIFVCNFDGTPKTLDLSVRTTCCTLTDASNVVSMSVLNSENNKSSAVHRMRGMFFFRWIIFEIDLVGGGGNMCVCSAPYIQLHRT